jgi:signal transduction histidine kinase
MPSTADRSLLTAAVEQMTDGVAVLTDGDVVAYANAALVRAVGADVAGRRLADFVEGTESGVSLEAAVASALRDGSWRGTVRSRRDDRQVWAAELAPLPARGKTKRVVAVLRDESGRHAGEQARMDLLSMVTHDIKGPLTVILGYTDLLNDPDEVVSRARLHDILGRIHDSAEQIHALVCNFVELSRVEAGRLESARRPVDVAELAGDVCESLRAAAGRKGVALETAISPVPAVIGDRPQLERALTNLVGNALKYTPLGGRVQVATRCGRNDVQLSVADTGPGISREDLAHVFDKYRRAAGEAVAEGTGLGLFITRTIVRAHGGDVTVETTVGAGATFTVHLPLP